MWDYKGLIAGTGPVAVETIALRIIMEKRRALRGEEWPISPPPLCAWLPRRAIPSRHESYGGDQAGARRLGGGSANLAVQHRRITVRSTEEREGVMRKWLAILSVAVSMAVLQPESVRAGGQETAAATSFAVYPIGHVQKAEGHTWLVLDAKYQPGLLGLDGFSHVYVFWWFDKNDTPQNRSTLQVHPRSDPKNPVTGVFATRSSSRPNLIALTLCKIVSIKDSVVEVESIDADPGTPILDLKPFAPDIDSASSVRLPDWWARPR
jgi:tRNA (adenine37-N6)-methyltransferase